MKNKIIEASGIPEDIKVYLKQDSAGWRVVEPIKDENGKLLWKRIILGTKRERRFMYFIIFLALVTYLAFNEQVDNYKRVMDNPCAYCNSCQLQTQQVIRDMQLNESRSKMEFNLNLTNG